jgi:RNA polymerase sigma factor (sigma-70 family)
MRLPRFPRRRSSPKLPRQEASLRPEAALREQMKRLQAKALKYARSRGLGETSKDAVQEAFWMLWQAAYDNGTETPEENTDKLFWRILRRRVTDTYRDAERRHALDEQHVLDISAYLESATNNLKVAEGALTNERLDYAIGALSEKRRTALLLHRDGHDAHEIAESMHLDYSTARWHVLEAQRHIRRQLNKEGYELPAPRPRGRAGVEE